VNAAALEVPFQPTLVHHDFKRDNVRLERGPDGWRVSGVFDLGECLIGDGEEDLVRSLFDARFTPREQCMEMVRAYAAARPLRPGHRERFLVHALRDALLVWWFWWQEGRPVAPGRSFREWAEPHVSPDPF
jgi:Ser/Thr protein kinase RdoA (MazF antagonist)